MSPVSTIRSPLKNAMLQDSKYRARRIKKEQNENVEILKLVYKWVR